MVLGLRTVSSGCVAIVVFEAVENHRIVIWLKLQDFIWPDKKQNQKDFLYLLQCIPYKKG